MHLKNRLTLLSFSFLIMGVTIILFLNQSILSVYAQSKELKDIGDITINDPNLKVELVNDEVIAPTSMAFLGPDDFLVLGKDGTVNRVTNGQMLPEPLLQLNTVNSKDERGMLGIDVLKQNSSTSSGGSTTTNPTYVFLYYTEGGVGGGTVDKTADGDGSDDGSSDQTTTTVIRNHLYRYELVNNKLVNPRLLLDLPA